MTSSWNYILWLALFIWMPASLLWLFNVGGVQGKLKPVAACSLLIGFLCLPFEYFIVQKALILHEGHFLGLFFAGIPLEDYLFFFTVTFLMAPVALKMQSLMGKEPLC